MKNLFTRKPIDVLNHIGDNGMIKQSRISHDLDISTGHVWNIISFMVSIRLIEAVDKQEYHKTYTLTRKGKKIYFHAKKIMDVLDGLYKRVYV